MGVSVDVFFFPVCSCARRMEKPQPLLRAMETFAPERGKKGLSNLECLLGEPPGHDDIAKASPALCLEAPVASKASWDMAVPRQRLQRAFGESRDQQLPEPGPLCHSCSCRERTAFSSQQGPAAAGSRPFLFHWRED